MRRELYLAALVHHPVDRDPVGHVWLEDVEVLGVGGLGPGELGQVVWVSGVPVEKLVLKTGFVYSVYSGVPGAGGHLGPLPPQAAPGGVAPGQQSGHTSGHV